jgi:DNA-binding transcriptional regulator YdaS (Cro superfamily)
MHLREHLNTSPRGEASRIARATGMSRMRISELASGRRTTPPKAAVALELATGARVLREAMCEDWAELWPELIPLRRLDRQKESAPRVKASAQMARA